MCIKTVEAAKQKASVITTFLQENGVTLAHSNALHLVGRMEGFENWHAFRKSLVSGGPVATVVASLSNEGPHTAYADWRNAFGNVCNIATGQLEYWDVQWRTDSDGNWDGPARHAEEADVREVLLLQKEGNLSSVVRINGETGILFEMQYYCTESAPDVAAVNPDVRSYDETVAALGRWHKPLSAMFGGISVVVPERAMLPDEQHPTLWVFVPQGSLTKQERVELDNWLQRVGYPDFRW